MRELLFPFVCVHTYMYVHVYVFVAVCCLCLCVPDTKWIFFCGGRIIYPLYVRVVLHISYYTYMYVDRSVCVVDSVLV